MRWNLSECSSGNGFPFLISASHFLQNILATWESVHICICVTLFTKLQSIQHCLWEPKYKRRVREWKRKKLNGEWFQRNRGKERKLKVLSRISYLIIIYMYLCLMDRQTGTSISIDVTLLSGFLCFLCKAYVHYSFVW